MENLRANVTFVAKWATKRRIVGKRKVMHTNARPIIKRRRMTLLGHVIRAENDDPMKCITFQNDDLLPNKPKKLRGGRWTPQGPMD